MRQTGIFAGRAQVVYPYGRYGWTRGGGKVWHGGLDLVGLDDTTVRMPYYKGKCITGRVVRARIARSPRRRRSTPRPGSTKRRPPPRSDARTGRSRNWPCA